MITAVRRIGSNNLEVTKQQQRRGPMGLTGPTGLTGLTGLTGVTGGGAGGGSGGGVPASARKI